MIKSWNYTVQIFHISYNIDSALSSDCVHWLVETNYMYNYILDTQKSQIYTPLLSMHEFDYRVKGVV